MIQGMLFALLSGITNGLYSAPIKVIKVWKWENLWLVFIVTSCLVMPTALVLATVPDWTAVLNPDFLFEQQQVTSEVPSASLLMRV